jgi:short-subunit dehydrogenase
MKEILPRFVARGDGHLVNIASAAGKSGYPGGATYCGTKHFVVGVSEAVRGELRGSGVDISCVMPVVVNTELATGLGQSRGIGSVNPEDVAKAIVEVLERPRFDVHVPKVMGPLNAGMWLIPRGPREALARALKADKVLGGADPNARRAYELRAASSQSGLSGPTSPRELED